MSLNVKQFPILSSVTIIILSALYLVSRIGLYDYHVGYLFVFSGIGFLILNLPSLLQDFLSRKGSMQHQNWWTNELLVCLYILFFIVLLSYIPNLNLGFVLGFAGICVFGLNVYQNARHLNRDFLIGLIVASVSALLIAGICWDGHYLSPLFVESIDLTKENKSSLDPLFHISISQVIKNYGALSNGLHMLTPIKYHFFSHYLFARISTITDIHLVYVYNIGYVLIFPVLLLHFFLRVITTLRAFFNITEQRTSLAMLIILFLGLTSIMPVLLFGNLAMRVWIANNTHLTSESYLISLLFLLCTINSLILVDQKSKGFKYFLFIFLPVAVALTTLSKVSTGCMLMVTLGYLFLRLGFLKNVYVFTSILLTSLVFILSAYLVFESDTANGSFQFMNFYRKNIPARPWEFISLFFFWTCSSGLLAFYLKSKNVQGIDMKKIMTCFEVLVVVAVTGFIPAAFIEIGGGSAVFFAEIQRWMGLVLVAALLSPAVIALEPPAWAVQSAKAFVILILAFNATFFVARAAKHNFLVRVYYVKPSEAKNIENIGFKKANTNYGDVPRILTRELVDSIDAKVKKNQTYITLKILMELDKIPHQDKLIYVRDYGYFAQRFPCFHYFHFIPAFSGFAAFQGVDTWCKGDGYFFDRGDVKRTDYDADQFCKTLKENHFNYLYEYDVLANRYTVRECK